MTFLGENVGPPYIQTIINLFLTFTHDKDSLCWTLNGHIDQSSTRILPDVVAELLYATSWSDPIPNT